MVDKQSVLSRSNDEDFLTDDDPFAELARIAGIERPAANLKVAPADRTEPEFDLEDELLREFELYDLPRPDGKPADKQAEVPVSARQDAEVADSGEDDAALHDGFDAPSGQGPKPRDESPILAFEEPASEGQDETAEFDALEDVAAETSISADSAARTEPAPVQPVELAVPDDDAFDSDFDDEELTLEFDEGAATDDPIEPLLAESGIVEEELPQPIWAGDSDADETDYEDSPEVTETGLSVEALLADEEVADRSSEDDFDTEAAVQHMQREPAYDAGGRMADSADIVEVPIGGPDDIIVDEDDISEELMDEESSDQPDHQDIYYSSGTAPEEGLENADEGSADLFTPNTVTPTTSDTEIAVANLEIASDRGAEDPVENGYVNAFDADLTEEFDRDQEEPVPEDYFEETVAMASHLQAEMPAPATDAVIDEPPVEDDLTQWDADQAFESPTKNNNEYQQPVDFRQDEDWDEILEPDADGEEPAMEVGNATIDEDADPTFDGLAETEYDARAIPAEPDAADAAAVDFRAEFDRVFAAEQAELTTPAAEVEETLPNSVQNSGDVDDWNTVDDETDLADLDSGDFGIDELLAEVERYPIPSTRPDWGLPEALPAVEKAKVEWSDELETAFEAEAGTETELPGYETAAYEAEGHQSAQVMPVWPQEPEEEELQSAIDQDIDDSRDELQTEADPAAPHAQTHIDSAQFDLSGDENPFDEADFELDLGEIERDLHGAEPQQAIPPQPAGAAPFAATEPARPVVANRWHDQSEVVAAAAQVAAANVPAGLHFDPGQIAETTEPVGVMAEIDVPVLPVDNNELRPASPPDFDLDIDAEMARMFSRSAQSGVTPKAPVADRQSSANPLPGSYIPSDNIDDFEKALEEDFRRSMTPETAASAEPDRVRLMPGNAEDYGEERGGRRRGFVIAASAVAIVLLGSAGLYAWMNRSEVLTAEGTGPRIILADKDPVKVVPEDKGGQTVPNQDKAVYDKVAGATTETPKQESLVSSTEEPVDVVQKTLVPETLPMDEDQPIATSTDDTSDPRLLPGAENAEPTTAANPVTGVQPRKVRTMIVKPDGTLVAREDLVDDAAAAEVAGVPSEVAPADVAAEEAAGTDAAAQSTDAAETAVANDNSQPVAAETVPEELKVEAPEVAAAEPGQAVDEVPADQAAALAAAANTDVPDSTEVQDNTPVRVVKTSKITVNAPVPESRPIDQPVNVVNTVTDQGNVTSGNNQAAQKVASAEPATATQTTQLPEGTYVVQIASLPSEAEAQQSYKNLSGKFASIIGGKGVDIKRAEISGKGTFYRVRIPAGSKSDAISLCTKYKKAGGSCLVSK